MISKKKQNFRRCICVLGTIIRFVVSALVLLVVSWFVPGVAVNGFTGALIAALVIALLGWVAESLLGENKSPQSRGIVGFLVAAIVIYAAQFIIPGQLSVSILGALLAALVIGLIDAVVPTVLR
ncbi:MAG: phage holin family protein [Clostridia bacterium]|nr:phage holin family protein [Clostridia bacterium]